MPFSRIQDGPDESWISISGKAVDPQRGFFTLDYGKESQTVNEGDYVSITGKMDAEMSKERRLKADTVTTLEADSSEP